LRFEKMILENQQRIAEAVSRAYEYNDLPGLAAGVVTPAGGSLFYSKGYANFKTRIPLHKEHVFHFASVSKLFVATAILQLVQNGQLSLEGFLLSVLPWFRPDDPAYATLTIRQILSHTAGIPDVKDYHWDKPETDSEALKRYILSGEVIRSPLISPAVSTGDSANAATEGPPSFRYSNIGYELLGAVIAELSGITFEEYVKTHIFNPLGMSDSTFLTFLRPSRRLASPHAKATDKRITVLKDYPYNRAHAPSSTLTSTLTDISKFGEAFLTKNPALLNEESYNQMWEEQAVVGGNSEGMGLAWFIRKQGGYTLYGHEGSDDGFRSSFWICPKLGTQITVLSNISDAPVKKINKSIFSAMAYE
jgi:CubicO group peptidase (beta-lactamase class C family)